MATGKLKEVEEDATRIQNKRFKEQLEEQEYQKAKLTAEESPKVGVATDKVIVEEPEVKKGK